MDMMQGGTFTLSSIGMFDVDNSDAILNIPQSAIVVVGRIKDEPVVLEDKTIRIRPKAYLSVTFDHETINGAPGSKFMKAFSHMAEKADEIIEWE